MADETWHRLSDGFPEGVVHSVIVWDGIHMYIDYIDPETGDWATGCGERYTHWRELPTAPTSGEKESN